MTWFQALILGIVQGITEFLPISSSAHLALVPHWLGWTFEPHKAFIFDVLVQMGTLVAVSGHYARELWQMVTSLVQSIKNRTPLRHWDRSARMGLLLAVSTLPGVAMGVAFKDEVEQAFTSPQVMAVLLMLTGLWMALGEILGKKYRTLRGLTLSDAFLIGWLQGLALFPGISRSGFTIGGALLRHFRRDAAAHFSFLISVPIMIGAGLVALWDLFSLPSKEFASLALPMLVGFSSAALSGYLAIQWLLGFLSRHSLWAFVAYCGIVGSLSWWFA